MSGGQIRDFKKSGTKCAGFCFEDWSQPEGFFGGGLAERERGPTDCRSEGGLHSPGESSRV